MSGDNESSGHCGFAEGDAVLLRQVLKGRVRTADPARVVLDDENGIALWMADGTVCARRFGQQTQVWHGPTVAITTPGAPCSFHLLRSKPGGPADHWYVNFEQPWRRSGLGFDTHDRILDIVVALDRDAWHSKDVEQLDAAANDGYLSEVEVDLIREQGTHLESRMPELLPALRLWETWALQSPPDWPPAELPEDWASHTTAQTLSDRDGSSTARLTLPLPPDVA